MTDAFVHPRSPLKATEDAARRCTSEAAIGAARRQRPGGPCHCPAQLARDPDPAPDPVTIFKITHRVLNGYERNLLYNFDIKQG